MILLFVMPQAVCAATEDIGNGFLHHGVAAPVSTSRGIVATVDGQRRNVVLVWLLDCRGGYGLLMIDAETGKSQQFPMPFPCGGYCVFASVFSSGSKLYTQFSRHFAEFDPAKRAFTFCAQGGGKIGSALTEDDNGVIWAVTYPNSELVSFNPRTREFKDYGSVHQESWDQLPSCIAADDAGWIYVGTASQVVAFDPQSGTGKPMLPQEERRRGAASLYRDLDGRVYGMPYRDAKQEWYEFYKGQGKKIGRHEQTRAKPIAASTYGLFLREFPDGKRIKTCDLVERILVVEDPKTGQLKESHFDYTSEGAPVMGLAAAPDGTICGGTAIPPRFFSYQPKTDQWIRRACFKQWNTVACQGDHFFVGAYNHGYLMEWDPSRPWVPTVKGKPDCNPVILTECAPTILRPSCLLAHPDGKTLVLSGGTGYGHVGGGLLFWDRQTRTRTVLEDTDIIPEHATISLLALPGGRLLGGTACPTSRRAEKGAGNSELYLMDMATKRVEWHEAVLPGVAAYKGFCLAPDGLVYGVAHPAHFFVFDPARKKIVHKEDLGRRLGPAVVHQGPRIFAVGANHAVYMLLIKGIARVEPGTHRVTMLAQSPVTIDAGGDILDGRIYFAHGSHLYSYRLPQ